MLGLESNHMKIYINELIENKKNQGHFSFEPLSSFVNVRLKARIARSGHICHLRLILLSY